MDWTQRYKAILAADLAVFSEDLAGDLLVLLVRRGDDSDAYPGRWALPGGLVEPGETFEQAARRELAEETSVTAPSGVVSVGVYDDPDRDPRGRVVSVAFAAVASGVPAAVAADDASDARWMPYADADALALAFDHNRILADARRVMGALL